MYQKLIIIGRVGKDPETRYIPSGGAVTSISVATSEQWKDKNSGEKKERTEWFDCTAFGKLAEIVAEYVNKGDLIAIEGRLRTESWDDQEGNKRYRTKVMMDQMRMLGGSKASSRGDGQEQQSSRPAQADMDDRAKPVIEEQFDDSEIPF